MIFVLTSLAAFAFVGHLARGHQGDAVDEWRRLAALGEHGARRGVDADRGDAVDKWRRAATATATATARRVGVDGWRRVVDLDGEVRVLRVRRSVRRDRVDRWKRGAGVAGVGQWRRVADVGGGVKAAGRATSTGDGRGVAVGEWRRVVDGDDVDYRRKRDTESRAPDVPVDVEDADMESGRRSRGKRKQDDAVERPHGATVKRMSEVGVDQAAEGDDGDGVARLMDAGGRSPDVVVDVERAAAAEGGGGGGDAVERLLEVYAPRSPLVSAECRNDSQRYLEAVRRGELWAARMVDASSKWPEGLLTGSLVQLGNYDECLAAKSPHFAGALCMATLDGVATLLARSDTPVARYLEAGKTTEATWSVCIPDTCSSSDVHGHLEHVIADLATARNASHLKVTAVTCLSRATLPKFTALDWAAVGVLALLAALVATSTVYDVLTKHSVTRHSLLTAFSAYSNGRVLLSPAKDSLPALHGLRMCNRIWDNLGQRYTRPMLSPAVNADKLDEYYSDWAHIFITNFSNSIDTIFFLSGLLVAYNFMKERHKGTAFHLLVFYLQRYIRFTPPFAMIMLLTSSLFRHAGDGPLWDARTEPNQQRCLDNWWLGFVYLNNYVNKDRQCLDQSWFNAAEMQLFWLCPLILIPLWRYPRYGKALLGSLICAGVVVRFIVAFVYEVPVDLPGPAGKGRLLYWPTHTRYVPWFVGLGAGYFLHQAEHVPPVMTRRQVALGWTLCVICLVAPTVLVKPFMEPGYQYNRFFDSLYLALFRPAFAFGLAWLVYACITGYGGVVNKFLSWSFFRVLSRTMYSFYLSHVSVMQLTSASLRHPLFVDDTYAITRWIGGFVISVMTSSMLCLVCEMPFVFMEQHFLGKIGHKPEKKRRNTPDIIVTGKEEGKPGEGGLEGAAAGAAGAAGEAALELRRDSSSESYRTAEFNGADLDSGTVCSASSWADWAEDKLRNTAEMVMSEERDEEAQSLELHLHPAPAEPAEDGDELRETLEVLVDTCAPDDDDDDFLMPGNFIF